MSSWQTIGLETLQLLSAHTALITDFGMFYNALQRVLGLVVLVQMHIIKSSGYLGSRTDKGSQILIVNIKSSKVTIIARKLGKTENQ